MPSKLARTRGKGCALREKWDQTTSAVIWKRVGARGTSTGYNTVQATIQVFSNWSMESGTMFPKNQWGMMKVINKSM